MNVLVVIHYFPPHLGGLEEVGRNQAASLARAGHDVTVITCRHDRRIAKTERVEPGYTVRRVRAMNFVESRFGVTFPIVSPLLLLTLFRAARRADLVHIHEVLYPPSHAAALAAKLARRPLFITQHVAVVAFPNALVRAVQRVAYRLAGRRLFRQARGIVTYNANVRDFVIAQGADPSTVLLHHNGIDTDYFSPTTDDEARRLRREYDLPVDRPVILFVGRLVPKKGYDILYEARSPAYFTLLAGNGYVDTGIRDDEDARFFGPANREQLRDLYRACDVFVFPALGEIFTLVMQEAMASGVPVVTTDDPGYAEYDLDRDGIAFVERSTSAVRAAIEEILGDEPRRRRMSAYSRGLAVERFSWESNFPDEEAIYANAIPDARVGATAEPMGERHA